MLLLCTPPIERKYDMVWSKIKPFLINKIIWFFTAVQFHKSLFSVLRVSGSIDNFIDLGCMVDRWYSPFIINRVSYYILAFLVNINDFFEWLFGYFIKILLFALGCPQVFSGTRWSNAIETLE